MARPLMLHARRPNLAFRLLQQPPCRNKKVLLLRSSHNAAIAARQPALAKDSAWCGIRHKGGTERGVLWRGGAFC